MEQSTCYYCENEAPLLCDGILGWRKAWDAQNHRWVIDTDFSKGDPAIKCDRPLCEECAITKGTSFYIGTENGKRFTDADTTDLCKQCNELGLYHGGRNLVTVEEGRALQALQLLKSFRANEMYRARESLRIIHSIALSEIGTGVSNDAIRKIEVEAKNALLIR